MTCACGRPVEVKSARQCRRCYKRDWRLTHDSERRVGNPRRAQQKAKYDYKPCPKCGAPRFHGSAGCWPCHLKEVQEGRDARRRVIELMWNDGRPQREIAEVLDTSPGTVAAEMSRMRADGWDLPFRNSYPR